MVRAELYERWELVSGALAMEPFIVDALFPSFDPRAAPCAALMLAGDPVACSLIVDISAKLRMTC